MEAKHVKVIFKGIVLAIIYLLQFGMNMSTMTPIINIQRWY